MTEDHFPIRGIKNPYTDEADDTQGHGGRFPRADAESAEGADTEGHAYAKWSDRNIKNQVEPVTWEGDADASADTEGHYARWSDRNLKDEVEPVTWEGESPTSDDDAEDNRARD